MPKDLDGGQESPPRAVEMRRRRRQPIVRTLGSPVYDLLLSMHVAFCPPRLSEFELSASWLEGAVAACPPELRETLAFYFGEEDGQWCAARLCALLWRSPAPESIDATLAWLAALPVEEVLTILLKQDGLGDDWREVAVTLMQSYASGGKDQAARVKPFTRRFPASEREAVARFVTEPEAERQRLIEAVRAWRRLVFAAEEPRISAIVSREAARLDRLRAELSLDELFGSVVRGIELDLPASIERLVLVPSLMIMPTIFHFTADDTITYCYPIADSEHASDDAETIQRREMVRLFEALADDTRLRILRYLAQRQMYLTELSEHLKLTKATTRHHMVRLRAAGLVTVHMRDHLSYYSLRRDTLDEPTRILSRYLGLA